MFLLVFNTCQIHRSIQNIELSFLHVDNNQKIYEIYDAVDKAMYLPSLEESCVLLSC